MAKLRHIAVATQDADRSAEFFMKAFGFRKVRRVDGSAVCGHILTDGTINLAILDFKTDEAAGKELGRKYSGLHHLGFEVENIEAATEQVVSANGTVRADINAALGIGRDDAEHHSGEFKFGGPDGLIFDLAEPGFWKFE